jgi:hypothetical protein
MQRTATLTRQRMRTPRAAAIAGIIFAVLFTLSVTMLRLVFPEDMSGASTSASLVQSAKTVKLALTFLPFAGIAFLWFIGVVRDRLGKYEDQFFSTVFFGSGLLFIAMAFSTAAIAGALVASLDVTLGTPLETDVVTFARALIYTILNVYAIRMAGVFMLSLGTIWLRTRVMPRLFIFLTYGFAALMLLAGSLSAWLVLILPAWVFVISVYILVVSLRGETLEAEEILGADEA